MGALMNFDTILPRLEEFGQTALTWLASPKFYGQIGLIVGAYLAAWLLARMIRPRVKTPESIPLPGGLGDVAPLLSNLLALTFPALRVGMLAIAAEVAKSTLGASPFIQIALAISVIALVRAFVAQFITNKMIIFVIAAV